VLCGILDFGSPPALIRRPWKDGELGLSYYLRAIPPGEPEGDGMALIPPDGGSRAALTISREADDVGSDRARGRLP